jgi:CheY-like chemotaxis protein/HPt (histidine-containing phosphotransfer) domain-containing protein
MGLGLALSKRLAGMLGGDITFSSAKGKGSTFVFTISTGSLEGVRMLQTSDMHEAEPSSPDGLTPPVLPQLSGRILLVEDGLDNQRLLALILRKAGANVTVVNNGKEALEKVIAQQKKYLAEGLQTSPFDVILMDMQMPQIDGYQATAALRAEGCTRPIIALTAHALSGDRDKCLAAGCTDYLTKPIDRSVMIRAVARHAGRAPGQSPSAAPGDAAAPSLFAGDAELAGVLDGFVAGLPARVRVMRDALAAGQYGELQRAAHQMKGAGGSFGFPELSRLGGELELPAKAGDVEAAGLALARLAELCAQIARGHRTHAESQSGRVHS